MGHGQTGQRCCFGPNCFGYQILLQRAVFAPPGEALQDSALCLFNHLQTQLVVVPQNFSAVCFCPKPSWIPEVTYILLQQSDGFEGTCVVWRQPAARWEKKKHNSNQRSQPECQRQPTAHSIKQLPNHRRQVQGLSLTLLESLCLEFKDSKTLACSWLPRLSPSQPSPDHYVATFGCPGRPRGRGFRLRTEEGRPEARGTRSTEHCKNTQQRSIGLRSTLTLRSSGKLKP